jgi:ketosteroid isomerase-like protein
VKRINWKFTAFLTILPALFCGINIAQSTRENSQVNVCSRAASLNGLYRVNLDDSDELYSVIEGASSKVPYSEQQQFFMDLAVRLTPPDLLAIECSGNRVSLGSSRAPRVEFLADGVTRRARAADGQTVRSRIGLERNSLVFTSTGRSDGNLSFSFTPIENGKRLRVTRRISTVELIDPVIIQTVYNRIADVARWDLYDEPPVNKQVAGQENNSRLPVARTTRPGSVGSGKVNAVREALNQWIDATNRRDIGQQMSFYMPELKAFYLARNASRNSVRIEKVRTFSGAKSIDIRAEEPEIIFQDAGQTAIMRFRKKYRVENGSRIRRGEVIQELRWQQTNGGWKIFSERDIKVIN